jgi:hypothetical protein
VRRQRKEGEHRSSSRWRRLQDAQNALRRIMETHSNVTRFCFICNYVSRIIEPLASRCAKFRFKPLHEGIMEQRVRHICGAEGVELGPGAMELLGKVSHGDLRRAITTLQSATSLAGSPVQAATLIDVSGEARSDTQPHANGPPCAQGVRCVLPVTAARAAARRAAARQHCVLPPQATMILRVLATSDEMAGLRA